MSYIDRSLGDGERIIGRAYFHWLYTLRACLGLIASLIVFAAIAGYADGTNRAWLNVAGLVLVLLGLVDFLRLMIRKWTTEIGVTSHRFVKKTGFIALHTNEIALPNIEGVRVQQGILGRVFGFGQIVIEGTGVDAVRNPTIADPVAFRRAIETAKGMK